MQFSNKIIQRSKEAKFIFKSKLDHSATIVLSHHAAKVQIHFNTIELNNEVCFSKVSFITDLEGEFLGILDAFVELMHSRPIEAIDRFPAKELDYFLRDDNSTPSISGLDEKFYEILGIGEEIKKSFFKIDQDHSPKLKQDFLSMSVSEQIEFIEEIFSYYFYSKDSEFSSFEIIDVDENKLTFESNSKDFVDAKKLEEFLSGKLKVAIKVSLID